MSGIKISIILLIFSLYFTRFHQDIELIPTAVTYFDYQRKAVLTLESLEEEERHLHLLFLEEVEALCQVVQKEQT